MASRSIEVGGASNTKRVVEEISVAGAIVVAPDATVVEATVVEVVAAGRATDSSVSELQEAVAAKSAAIAKDVGGLRTSR